MASFEGSVADGAPGSCPEDRQMKLETIRTLCQIAESDDDNDNDNYAVQLLEAASGSIERAVQIHFDSSLSTYSNDRREKYRSPETEVKEKKPVESPGPDAAGTKQSATNSPSTNRKGVGRNQGTRDQFFGLAPQSIESASASAKSRKAHQTTLENFFATAKRRRPAEADDANLAVGGDADGCSTDNRKVRPSANHVAGRDNSPCSLEAPDKDASNRQPDRLIHSEPEGVVVDLTSPHSEGSAALSCSSSVPAPPSSPPPASSFSPLLLATNSLSEDCDVPYQWLSETLATISDTTKRTTKLAALTRLFRRLLDHVGGVGDGTSIEEGFTGRENRVRVFVAAIELILGKVGSEGTNESAPLQVSGSSISAAVQAVTGATRQQLQHAYRKTGDFGDSAAQYFQSRSSSMKRFFVARGATGQSVSRLTLRRVQKSLREIANVAPGKGSQALRKDLMIKLLRHCQDKNELRFLVRVLLGNMRLGATIKTVVAALAAAFVDANPLSEGQSSAPSTDSAAALQRVFCLCPRLDRIVEALLTGGVPQAVQHCTVEVFHPVQPMLANPARSLEEVRELVACGASSNSEWEEAVAEWKYDGVRCQAHYDGTTIKLYSRNLIENTRQYPDAVELLRQATKPTVTSFILDSELVGVTPCAQSRDGFRLLPFQDLSTRRGVLPKDGKVDNTTVSQPVQVRIYAFDVLHLNGESVLHLPLWRRQGLLRDYFVATSGFGLATSVRLARYDEVLVESALRESVQDGAEGLMIKLTGRRTSGPDSKATDDSNARVYGYEAGTRSQSWLKVKRDYVGGDVGGSTTIDVVPIGAWYGTGRKAKNGYLSPVLLAVYDDDEGVYYSISRCMSFSDEMYEAMREFYFHGSPYPNRVGINEDHNDKNTATDQDPKDDVELEEPNADGAAKGSEVVCGDDEARQRVNCLGARPSWIVTNESPPIWFQPSEVFEVSFADLSLSTSHTAANDIVGCNGRGVSLRFPRFKRRRPDKNVDQATTPAEVARLYFQQAKIQTPR